MSWKGHVPIRMCMGCRKRRKKEEMIRFAQTAGGKALAPGGKNQDGRGFYLCPDLSCLKAAKKKRRLEPSIDIDRFQECFEKNVLPGTRIKIKEEAGCRR